MANGVQFSTTWNATLKRIRNIPKMNVAQGIADAQRKRDAYELVQIWREGLQKGNFTLIPLRPQTIARKRSLAYRYPSSPLYGLGMDGTRTYVKGMRVWKTAKGYTVHMVNGKHHSSKLSLASLFEVHEYGTTIMRGGKTTIIPARPAMQKSWERLLRRLAAQDPTEEFNEAVKQYILAGRMELIKKIQSRAAEMEARNK